MVVSYFYVDTNPSCLSRLSCQFFSNWFASHQDNPIIFPIRKITSQFSQRCSLHPSPSCLCFLALPPFFFKDSEISNQLSILFMISFFILFNQCSYPVVLMKMFFKFIILHSFLLRWIQFKLCRSYLSLFQMFSHAGAPLNHPILVIQLFRSAEDISEGLSFHSRSVQAISRSYLIQAI